MRPLESGILNSHSEETERAVHMHGSSGKHAESSTKAHTGTSGYTAGQNNIIKMTSTFWFNLWVIPELLGLSLRAPTRQRL